MDRKSRFYFGILCLFLCLTSIFFSCGSSRKVSIPSKKYAEVDPLTPEERRKFDYYFLEAVRLKEIGKMDEAFEMYSHCLDIHPESAATLYELAKFYMYMGQLQRGEECLRKAMNTEPGNYWYKETLAAYYQSKGENAKAIDVIEQMALQSPSRLEPLMALVDMYNRTQDYEKMIHALNRLEKLDGKSEQLSMEKFRAYQAMDSTERAFEEMKSLAEEYPYDLRYLTVLGDLYMREGQMDEAYEVFRQVLAKDSTYVYGKLSLATYYEQTGQDSLCRELLDSLLLEKRVGSNDKLFIMRQVIHRSEVGDKDSIRVAGLFQAMLKQEQENADVAMLAAQYLLSKRMNEEVKPVLWKVLEIDPENKPARLQLLSFAISKEDLDEVIKICAPAVEYMPESLEFYYYWGLAHYQKDQEDEAMEVFEKGVRQIGPDSDKNIASDFYSILGDLYHAKKLTREAYAAYDSALVYNPGNVGVLNNYAYYLSLEKEQLDKAEEMSYRTVKAEPTNDTYLDTYAWILFEKGKYAEARIYIDQAIQNGGDKSSVVVEHCGDIYYLSGEHEKAVEYWMQAEKLAKEPVEEGREPREEKELKLLKKKIANKKYYAE